MILQDTDKKFTVVVTAKSGERGLEYWVVLYNDKYDPRSVLLDAEGKFSIFHSSNIETTIQEAKVWAKFLGVELDISSIESAASTVAMQPEKKDLLNNSKNLSRSVFGSLKKRAHMTFDSK